MRYSEIVEATMYRGGEVTADAPITWYTPVKDIARGYANAKTADIHTHDIDIDNLRLADLGRSETITSINSLLGAIVKQSAIPLDTVKNEAMALKQSFNQNQPSRASTHTLIHTEKNFKHFLKLFGFDGIILSEHGEITYGIISNH